MAALNQTSFTESTYRQVKNPNPVFTPREDAGTLKFCEKLMEKAVGFTSRFDFAAHVAYARSRGLRRRMPPVLRRRAIDALLQGLCFHYDPLVPTACSAPSPRCTIECGLATESEAGKLSITRATRALKFLSELGLITYQTEYDPTIGCNIPTDITFTPALFDSLDISEEAVASARRSRVEWENRLRKKQGMDALGMDELIARAWRFVRERFRSYQAELKSHGMKRARARRDAGRTRQDIVTLVKRQLTREIAEGRFRGSLEAVKREIDRRVKERMIMSRNNNYTRLTTASPLV
ncbi:incFII family plasmid replication initiator RepA (plasmid) [Escherichia coli]